MHHAASQCSSCANPPIDNASVTGSGCDVVDAQAEKDLAVDDAYTRGRFKASPQRVKAIVSQNAGKASGGRLQV